MVLNRKSTLINCGSHRHYHRPAFSGSVNGSLLVGGKSASSSSPLRLVQSGGSHATDKVEHVLLLKGHGPI